VSQQQTTVHVPRLTLNDGHSIPQLGFGVFQIPPDRTPEAVSRALATGYRHVDTAEMYGNEKEVGEAVRAAGVDRSEVFVTSKLSNAAHRPDDARRAFEGTLEALGLEYVDLFLIHWPLPTVEGIDYLETWRTVIEFARDGRARSIGVSNFQVPHLQRIIGGTGVTPAVNQVEVHPYFTNEEVRAFGREHGIVTEAWSPIAQGAVLGDPEVLRVAELVQRTPAQVVLRWHLQRGDVVFPKSVTPARIEENFALFDFALDDEAMSALSHLNKGSAGRTGADPDTFDYVP
jgi:2,5-diketo-D-gluconate reductase A